MHTSVNESTSQFTVYPVVGHDAILSLGSANDVYLIAQQPKTIFHLCHNFCLRTAQVNQKRNFQLSGR